MESTILANEPVIYFLKTGRTVTVEPNEVTRPTDWRPYYANAGSHPDVVERLWDGFNSRLPTDCRAVFGGTPALVIPASGVVIAVGLGTAYLLRLPLPLAEYQKAENARIVTCWSNGGSMNVQEEIGPDWVFGSFSHQEVEWLLQSYNRYAAE